MNKAAAYSHTTLKRILLVIPHYFGAGPDYYGSTNPTCRDQRITALQRCISAIHQNIGGSQMFLSSQDKADDASLLLRHEVKIVICTTAHDHVLNDLPLNSDCYQQRICTPDTPMNLGFCCYHAMQEEYGNFDWYCYLEDDIIINDPLFFHKLSLFNTCAHDAYYLLQPHRFELCNSGAPKKQYIDGPMWNNAREIMERLRLPDCKSEISLDCRSTGNIRTVTADNPHAGCFFLTPEQLWILMQQSWFGQPLSGFVGPLESSATLPIMTMFNIFKPAVKHAAFLEVHHHHQTQARRADFSGPTEKNA